MKAVGFAVSDRSGAKDLMEPGSIYTIVRNLPHKLVVILVTVSGTQRLKATKETHQKQIGDSRIGMDRTNQ